MDASPPTIVGTSLLRTEARPKVTGAARYVDDLVLPEMIFGATVRTQGPHGRLVAIEFGEGLPWSEFTVVTAADIPGQNVVALINNDQPCLVPLGGIYHHAEEPVVLLAHKDRVMLSRAVAAIRLVVEPRKAVLSIDESLAAIERGEPMLLKEYAISKGDIKAAFAKADLVVEGVYETGSQEHLYIETNGMIAQVTEADGVTVWGSLQCPYYVQKALMGIFNVPAERARVIQMETGGGFGGKEEYPSMIAAHAALLAHKAGRPVKIIYDRAEDMAATTKRHPSRTRHRTAVLRDGTILGMEIDFVLDGGAYSTLSQVVLSRGAIHAAGPYACDNVAVRARAVLTHTPPHGAFRGFGAPQSIFAVERHLDVVAKALGLSPVVLRRRNFIQKGGTLATGQVLPAEPGLAPEMDQLLTLALEASQYAEKQERYKKDQSGPLRRGMGLAAFLHGTGFTGSGESYLASVAAVELTKDGKVSVLSSSTEIGQGTNTVFSQIAAQALAISPALVEVAQPDTGHVPNSGPTVASRTCTIVGRLIERAATELRKTLFGEEQPPSDQAFVERAQTYLAEHGSLRQTATYQAPPGIVWDEQRFRGDAYGAYSYAVYVAEVEVDLRTYEARVLAFWAMQEAGRVVNPHLAEGQIEGGVVQGIGFALYENVAWKEGSMTNRRMTDYIIPTAADVPPIHVHFVESPYPYGAFGAKGIGELPMDGPAPAILNAIEDAVGVSICQVPATPEVIFAHVEAARAGGAHV